ncbi:MAG: class I SAM-dependent methyltransferase [Chitinophagales bacterium]|nr:class I SAM-dependent methyltransferase [Chitinophagales bacterium]
MKYLHRVIQWLSYQWSASSKYYIHSPFVYDFCCNVLTISDDQTLLRIYEERKNIGNSHLQVEPNAEPAHCQINLKKIEKCVAVQHKYGKVLYAMSRHYKPDTIIELGTSLGISTAYLALGNPEAKVVTADANTTTTAYARVFHQKLGLSNVTYLNGDFDVLLPQLLSHTSLYTLMFIDGNHRHDAVLRYFQTFLPRLSSQCIIIFDDIYWSRDMTEAWKQICQNLQVRLTIDLYQFGICFLRKENLAKENFRLRY